MSPVLAVHIAVGSVAVVAGYAALFSRKGARLHRRAGLLFVAAMLVLGGTAVALNVMQGKEAMGGVLVAYFVLTGLTTVHPLPRGGRSFDIMLMCVGFALGAISVVGGVTAILSPGGRNADGVPGWPILLVGLATLLAPLGDARVLRRGALGGRARMRRHLWRMCFAFFMATGSFFLGQARVIPEPLRIWPLLSLAAFLPLFGMLYWLWRQRDRRPRVATPAVLGAVVPETP